VGKEWKSSICQDVSYFQLIFSNRDPEMYVIILAFHAEKEIIIRVKRQSLHSFVDIVFPLREQIMNRILTGEEFRQAYGSRMLN
jgi:hypothetical protein